MEDLRLNPQLRLCANFDETSIAKFPVAAPKEMGMRVLDNCAEEHIMCPCRALRRSLPAVSPRARRRGGAAGSSLCPDCVPPLQVIFSGITKPPCFLLMCS